MGDRARRRLKRLAARLLFAGSLLLPSALQAQTVTVAGVTDGALSVDVGGSATYSIPIKVPPGIAGMAPGLSLNYSSGNGNGFLGMGWALNEPSVVHRCRRTIAQDGAVGGVNYDAGDRFCLDGRRLVAVAGAYGANGTEYRTEIESFTKVVSFGTAGAGPAWFKAWTKSGQVIEYGNTADSRVEAVGRSDVRFWAASRISDTVGNYLTQSYAEDQVTGSHRITRIDYAGNAGAAVAPFASVRFSYELSPDPFTGYQAGSPITRDRRLTAVRSYLGASLVNDYRFAYETSAATGRSRLLSVTECDRVGNCLAPTSFAWTPDTSGFTNEAALALPADLYDGATGVRRGDLIDLDGDGLQDLIYSANVFGTDYRSAWLNTGTGWKVSAAYAPDFHAYFYDTVSPWGRRNGDYVDVDGDGLLDFVQSVMVSGTSHRTTWLNTGSGWKVSDAYRTPFNIREYNKTTTSEPFDPGPIRFDPNRPQGSADPAVRPYHLDLRPPYAADGENDGSGFDFTPAQSTTTYLNRIRGQFVDVDGDGLQDYVEAIGIGSEDFRTTWRNTGAGWQVSAAHRALFHIYTTGDRRQGDFVDVNGDGLLDFVQALRIQNTAYRSTWLSTGSGWRVSAAHLTPFVMYDYWTDTTSGSFDIGPIRFDGNRSRGAADPATRFYYLGLKQFHAVDREYDRSRSVLQLATSHSTTRARIRGQLVDVNGDGLQDYVEAIKIDAGSYRTTWLNTGGGWQASAIHQAPFHIYAIDATTPDTAGGRKEGDFVDVDGDGLLDFVRAVKIENTSYRSTWLNTPSGWRVSDVHRPPFDMRNYWQTTESSGSLKTGSLTTITNNFSRVYGNIADIDGDGAQDLVQASTISRATWLTNSAAPDRLAAVTDSLGTTTSISYAPLTDKAVYEKGTGAAFPVQDIQVPLYVVSEIATDDGIGGLARTSYAYAAARNDLSGRGLLGFGRMHATDGQTGVTTTTMYRQDFPYVGQVAFTETYLADDTTVNTITNTWEALSLNGGATVFPFLSRSVAEGYEINHGPGNLPLTTVTTDSTYDAFGNVTKIIATTVGAGQSFVTTTTNSYTNDTVKWHLGRLTRATAKKDLPGLRSATRTSAFAYYPTGLLSREVVEPDLPALRLATEYTYDVFGNVTRTTVSGADIVTRATTTTYSADGRFPTEIANALGHRETRDHDPRFGTVTSLTGPNGITTTWGYDGFGRQVREDRPDGTASLWEFELCTTRCPVGGVYLARSKDIIAATGTITGAISTDYFDALNRVFRSETEGFDGTPVHRDTVFNARGEAEKVSRPYFAGTPATEIQWITTATDTAGRVTSVTAPDDGVETTDYDGLTVTETNALGQSRTKTKNAIGQLVQVTDNLGTTVTYGYTPHGNLEVTNAGGVVMRMTYDIRGRKKTMNDPDMGFWSYGYNTLGELVRQTDAKGQVATMEYDELGRMTSRTEPEGTTTWTYDNPLKTAAVGKPDTVSRTGDDYVEDYTYDALGRASRATVTYEGATYPTSNTYDSAGRLATLTYPGGFAVEQGYNAFGYLEEVRKFGGAGTVYWRAVNVDAEGRTLEEQFGNGLTTLRDFDPADGLIRSIGTFNGLTPLQDLTYDFDLLGNLKFRADGRQGREESFTYDGLNRLKSATVTTITDGVLLTQLGQTTYDYDALGNITFKSDVGLYGYSGGGGASDFVAGPHAVTSAGDKTYAYNANGAMTSTAIAATGALTRSVSWSSFNKPVHIQAHDRLATSDFVYGPDRGRIKQTVVKGSVISTITYVGGLFERHVKGGTAEQLKHFIRAGATVAVYTRAGGGGGTSTNDTTTDKTRYLHRDHLGSIDLITDEAGLIVERLSYDAHGKRRATDWQAASGVILAQEMRRGFTGHEHLDEVGLIHMNGRVYDPEIGRFLSADPNVQAPESSQSFNRYSYVNNNPLSFTDPSGFFFKSIGKAFKSIGKAFVKLNQAIWKGVKWALTHPIIGPILQVTATAVASYYCGPCAIGVAAAFSVATAAAGGAGVKDAIGAGVFAAVMTTFTYAIGDIFSSVGPESGLASFIVRGTAKAVAHGVVAGVQSHVRGDNFLTGFATGAVASVAGSLANTIPGKGFAAVMAKTATTAAAGGATAELGGGKFRNGAITGAYQYLLNDLLHVGGSFRLAKWLARTVRRIFNLEFEPKGGSAGIVISGIGKSGSRSPIDFDKLDIGVFVVSEIEGFDVGLGRATFDIGGSALERISDMDGLGLEANIMIDNVGVTVDFGTDSLVPTGFELNLGAGLNAGVSGTFTGTYSIREALDDVRNLLNDQ